MLDEVVERDGRRDAAAVVRPFYALDARWAAGVTASKDDRIDSIYSAGKIVGQYRHREDQAEVFGGWSAGLVDGWVRRYSLGVSPPAPTRAGRWRTAPPAWRDRAGPAVSRCPAPPARPRPAHGALSGCGAPGGRRGRRRELEIAAEIELEDRFEKELNRNLIGRPEFFALGLNSTLQLGRASSGLHRAGGR